MTNWIDVFEEKQYKKIGEFILQQMKECNKDVCEMEYALHKIICEATYDYENNHHEEII